MLCTDWPWYEGARACAQRRRGKDSAARVSCEWPRRKLSLKWDFRGTIGEHKRAEHSSPPSPHDRACLSLCLVVNIGPPLTYFTASVLPPTPTRTHAFPFQHSAVSDPVHNNWATSEVEDLLLEPELCFHHVSERGSPDEGNYYTQIRENLR